MISCVIGTRAQLIKMAPVILELERRKLKLQIVLTGQHKTTMDTLFNDFKIKTVPMQIENPNEVSNIFKMLFWFPRVLWKLFVKRKEIFHCNHEKGWILVHGDTLSTLIGAFVGKFTDCKVAHVESGLRSHSFFSPFPEEITRVLTFKLSDVGFCPGQWAVDNLKKNIIAVNTFHNTIIDSVHLVVQSQSESVHVFNKKYVVVSIHRFENIYNKSRLRQILDVIDHIAKKYFLVFVLHPATENRLERYQWKSELEQNENILIKPRMGYFEFLRMLSGSSFVMTDGGSNQEELAYLQIPTLIMRDVTERPEGLGQTATLKGYEESVARNFLANLEASKKEPIENYQSPSQIIVDYLCQN